VDDLVTTAREEFSDRASTLIDETSQRLERELDRRQGRAGGEPEPDYHKHPGYRERLETVPRRLYRDPKREKIGGVCAGIARYYGVEPWVVRCIAVTGLLFFPTIVFPAYWIAYFVMDKPPNPNGRRPSKRGCRDRNARRGRHDHRSPAPELGPRFSPRYSLRNVQADLTEVELRLRRMETHVTSGQYELQRELNKIDGGSDGRSG
jgi:phage shock protein C